MTEQAINRRVEAQNRAQERLRHLNKALGLSWRKIAKMDDFRGISHATLWSIANDPNFEPSAAVARKLGWPPKRPRIAADLADQKQQALAKELAASYNCTWSELVQAILFIYDRGENPFSFEELPMK